MLTIRGRRAATLALPFCAGWALVAAVAAAPGAHAAGAHDRVGFASPVLVDPDLGGGEPFVLYSHKVHDLVYASHGGLSHLLRSGLEASPVPVVCPDPSTHTCFDDLVNIWTSADAGATWTRSRGLERLAYTGLSDPDLSEDTAGNIYSTGTGPLVQDSLFSSADGGKTWPTGTPQCHDGDRPWVAAAGDREVFFANTPVEDVLERQVYLSTDGGATCSATGSPDFGTTPAGSVFTGQGKLLLDSHDGSLIGPQGYFDSRTLQNRTGLGISRLPDALHAVPAGTPFTNIYHLDTTVQSFFQPRLAMDAAENLYLTWATNDRVPGTTGGCGGAATPLPSVVKLVVGVHSGPGTWTWSSPVDINQPSSGQDMWPSVTAGDAGELSVVWYHRDKLDDLDCGQLNGVDVNANTYIYEAHITNAQAADRRTVSITNVSGRSIHSGQICMSGTLCVATGKDRRLGDFLTNSIDGDGCVLIASGDTEVPQAQGQALSRPIFIRQVSGPGLTDKAPSLWPAVMPALVMIFPRRRMLRRASAEGLLSGISRTTTAAMAGERGFEPLIG